MSTEKDAMALAVLDKWSDTEERRCNHKSPGKCSVCIQRREARAHLASRIAELVAEIAREKDYSAGAANRVLKAELAERKAAARATRAEAELAAVRANAERYVWLRDSRTTFGVSAQYDDAGKAIFYTRLHGYGTNSADVDTAIDAARGGG